MIDKCYGTKDINTYVNVVVYVGMQVSCWAISVYKPMNTGPVQGEQADVPGDLKTFKLDASGCGCECVARFSFCVNQIKTAMFVVYLGPYNLFPT